MDNQTKTPEIKKWNGTVPTHCELCGNPLKDNFIDGSFTGTNHWGIFCNPCYQKVGNGYGTGKGQFYNLKTLEKIYG
jgi:hypothetical protein